MLAGACPGIVVMCGVNIQFLHTSRFLARVKHLALRLPCLLVGVAWRTMQLLQYYVSCPHCQKGFTTHHDSTLTWTAELDVALRTRLHQHCYSASHANLPWADALFVPVTVHSEDGEEELQYIKPDIEEYKGSGKGASNPRGSASTGPPPSNRSFEDMLRTISNTQTTILELLDRVSDRLDSGDPLPRPWRCEQSRRDPNARDRSPRRR